MKKNAFFKTGILLLSLLLLSGILGCGTSAFPAATRTSAVIGLASVFSPVASGEGVPEAGAYNPLEPGAHQLVLLYNSGEPHEWNVLLPAERTPSSVRDVELVALLSPETEVELDTRGYIGGPPITRYAFEVAVEIREAQTGRMLWAGKVRGYVPPFPEQAPVEQTRLEGSHVSYADIESVFACRIAPRQAEVCILEGHSDGVYEVTFSHDGQVLASVSRDGTVRMWRVSDSTLLYTLEGQDFLIFSPDGRTFATMQRRSTPVQLRQVSDGALLRTIDHGYYVDGAVFSPDGLILATWADDRIFLWRILDGALQSTLESDVLGNRDSIVSVAFSPDGQYLAAGTLDNAVRLWQVADGSLLATLKGHSGSVWQVVFSPDSRYLVSSSRDGVRLWQVLNGTLLRQLAGQIDGAFSPDRQTLATRSSDYVLRVWRVSDGTLLHTLQTPSRSDSYAFSPDATFLASAGSEGPGRILTIGLWRVSTGALERTLEWGAVDDVKRISFSPDGQTLAVGGEFFDEPVLLLWQIKPATATATPTGISAP